MHTGRRIGERAQCGSPKPLAHCELQAARSNRTRAARFLTASGGAAGGRFMACGARLRGADATLWPAEMRSARLCKFGSRCAVRAPFGEPPIGGHDAKMFARLTRLDICVRRVLCGRRRHMKGSTGCVFAAACPCVCVCVCACLCARLSVRASTCCYTL